MLHHVLTRLLVCFSLSIKLIWYVNIHNSKFWQPRFKGTGVCHRSDFALLLFRPRNKDSLWLTSEPWKFLRMQTTENLNPEIILFDAGSQWGRKKKKGRKGSR
jgi:hypothetical protein